MVIVAARSPMGGVYSAINWNDPGSAGGSGGSGGSGGHGGAVLADEVGVGGIGGASYLNLRGALEDIGGITDYYDS